VTQVVRNIKYTITTLPLRNRRHCQILDRILDHTLDHIRLPPYYLWHSRVTFLQAIPPLLQEPVLPLYRGHVSGGKESIEPGEAGSGRLVGNAAADNSLGCGFADNHLRVEGKLDGPAHRDGGRYGRRSWERNDLHGLTIRAEGGHRDHPNVPEDNRRGHRASQRENLNHGASGEAGTSSEILSETWTAASNGTHAVRDSGEGEALRDLPGDSRNCEVVMS